MLVRNETRLPVELWVGEVAYVLGRDEQVGLPLDLDCDLNLAHPHLHGEGYAFRLEDVRHWFEHEFVHREGSFFVRAVLEEGRAKVLRLLPPMLLRNCLPCRVQINLLCQEWKEQALELDVQESLPLHEFSANWQLSMRVRVTGFNASDIVLIARPGDRLPSEKRVAMHDYRSVPSFVELKSDLHQHVRRMVLFCRNLGVLELPLPIIIVGRTPFAGQLLQ